MILPYLHTILFLISNVLAQPLPPDVPSGKSLDPREIKFTQRSEWNIIWSCLATLFACSWVAIHPNIPAPSDNLWRVLSRRVLMMFYMLLAPELVIIWAGLQRYAALEIAERNKEHGWTRTHAFFALMGGFMLYEDGAISRVLSPDELEHLFADGRIDWPTISEKEIEDRSKGDIFSKGFAILQTAWFATQCTVRYMYRLPLSHLEIITVAFAMLNVAVYCLWWNKPKDVGCPIPVHLLLPLTGAQHPPSKQETRIQPGDQYHSEADDNNCQLPSLKLPAFVPRIESIDTVDPQVMFTNLELESNFPDPHSSISLQTFDLAMPETEPIDTVNSQSVTKHGMQSNIPKSHSSIPLRPSSTFETVWSYIWGKFLVMGPLVILYLLVYKSVVSIWSHLGLMITSNTVDNQHGTQSVPIFYSPNPRKREASESLFAIALIIGTLFGGIHCIAWFFPFSSIHEQYLWRISALIIAMAPISLTLGGTMLINLEPYLIIFAYPILLAYIIARFMLLILPFLALRSLPSDSFITVDWIASIPHI